MKQLLFVYQAKSDLFNTVTDFAHKIISPSTYPCKLCALTYGNFSIKQDWKTFIKNLPLTSVFLHRDEFSKKYLQSNELPAVFLQEDQHINQLISKEEIEACESLPDLKNLVIKKLQVHDQHYHTHL